jgi:DNA-binding transcriptional LysR family regulator
MAQARQSLGSLDQNPRGQLRIGSTPAASQFVLPTVMREFKDSFPQYNISILPGETPNIIERLEEGGLDLGICLRPRDAAKLDCRPIFEDELVFLTSPLHPWCRQPPKARDIQDETFIIASRNSSTFELISEYFLKLGVRPKSVIELGNTEAIKELVKLGLGIAMSGTWTARSELAAGKLAAVPLVKTRIRRQWVVCHLKQKPVTLAEQIFMGLCREVGEEINP